MVVKQVFKCIVIIIIVGSVYIYKEPLAKFLVNHIQFEEQKSDTLSTNSYFNNKNYQYVSITDNFYPKSKQDLINIFYTILNAGMSEFTFYCDEEYKNCINDVDKISNDRILLSNINNFVNPYNSFQDIETTRYEATGKVIIKIKYTYQKEEIEQIKSKILEIMKAKVTNTMTIEEKIKVIHDYVIETTTYDSKKSDENINQYQSHIAYGPLFEGYGVCNGYADTMKLFLNSLGVESIKIASENHIWNLVYLDGKWLHLDLTWDDPVLDNGKEIIDYEYYLITTEELYEKEDNQHYFDKDIYKEAL